MDSQKISKLYNLNKLVNLRWASFNDNDISKLEGLDNCSKLEELSVNNNNISSFNGKWRRRHFVDYCSSVTAAMTSLSPQACPSCTA